MENHRRPPFRRHHATAWPIIVVCLAVAAVSGCGLPAAVTVGSLAASGVSYATTGKGLAGHVMSELSGEDCALHRPLDDVPICHAVADEQVIVANAQPRRETSLQVPHRTEMAVARMESTRPETITSIMRRHLRAFDVANGIKPSY